MVSKNRPLSSACCSSLPFHGEIPRLLSPQGTSLKSFSVNFHPLPNSDNPFLPPTPQWRICPRSLCPPLTSFFDCSLSCRQHAAYANTRSFIWEFPPLNECSLKWGHTFCRGGQRNTHIKQSEVVARSLWYAVAPMLTWAHIIPGFSLSRQMEGEKIKAEQRRPWLLFFTFLVNMLQRRTCDLLSGENGHQQA